MTKLNAKQRATRVPSTKGLKDVPPSAVLLSKVDKVESIFSAVPKDYSLWSSIPFESLESFDLGVIRIENFPMCCGAGIAHSFMYSNNFTANQKIQALAEIERRFRSQFRGIGMLIVNDEQLPVWQKSLLEQGWQCVTASSNPVHSNQTIVYLFTKTFGAKTVELPKKKSVAA